MSETNQKTDYFPYLLLVPALFITLLIVAWPLAETVRLSFTDASLNPNEEYIGFANYERILSRRFPEVIGRTFLWMSLSVALKLTIGLMGALLLNAAVPGRTLFRILTMPPWIIPIAIGMFIWGWMYNGQFGMISGLMQRIGLADGPLEFLAAKDTAFLATVISDVWIGVPMVAVYLLAAMQSVSTDMYEAAWVDGASRWYRIRRITIPLITPSIVTIGILSAIWTFNSFDAIWILTQGGPRSGTTTMIIDTYKVAIDRFRYGEGAARAVLIVLIMLSFSLAYYMVLRKLSKSGATK